MYTQSEREHDRINRSTVCLRGPWGGREGKRMIEWITLKYIASVHEDDIAKCTVSCRIVGEQGDRESISNRGVNMIKAQYIHVWNTKLKSPLIINTHLRKEGQSVKQVLSGVGCSEREEGKCRWWRRANMMDVFCVHAWK
jgi:hypothetical protein